MLKSSLQSVGFNAIADNAGLSSFI